MEQYASRSFRRLAKLAVALLVAIPAAFGQSKDAVQPVDVSGFVDMYFSKNLAQPASRTDKLRNFDFQDNQFTLSLAEIVFQKKASPVGFRVDADFGPTNDLVQTGSGSATLPIVQQAFLTAVIPIGVGLTLDAGKFVTHMGNEVIESKDNWNYSRSLLFSWAIPYYHTGVRFTYPITETFTGALHIVNGWNSVTDNNDSKSLGLTLNYAPLSTTGVVLNVITGHENLTPVEYGARNVYDLIITHQLTESLALVLNADYGEAQTYGGLAMWKGADIYGRYEFGPKSAVALRAEIFDDPQGYATGVGIPNLDVMEVTGTYEYRFADALLVRGEARYDFSNVEIFDKKTNVNTQSDQLTFLVGLVAIF